MKTEAVKVGQVWQDCDWRTYGNRFIRVIHIEGEHAFCLRCDVNGKALKKNTTRVLLRRFRATSTGYTLIAGPEPVDGALT